MQLRHGRFPLFSSSTFVTALALFAIVGGGLHPAQAEILVKDGQKVAFMGDSITQGGWSSPGG